MTNRRLSLLLLTTILVSGVGLGGWSTPRPGLAQDIQVTADVTLYQGDVEDVSVFYEPLAPYGTWIALPEHGQVWVPHGVPAGWRPYTAGRWVYTEHGWTWVSDWEWGWAPFHYGRWTFAGAHGWVWVPSTVWGPAWVAWRHAPGWVGWAPLPPQAVFRPGLGLSVANIDVHIRPSWFCFVEERHILAPRVVRHIAPPARNPSLIHITQNVTNYTVIQNRVVNHSIPVQRIERATARPVPRMRIVEDNAPEATRGARVKEREREVVLFRPDAGRHGRATLPETQTPRNAPPGQRAPDTTSPQPPQDAHRRLQEQQIRERAALEESQRQARERAALEERQRQARERAMIEERQHRTPQPQSVSPEDLRRRDEAQRRALEDKARRDRQTREQPPSQPQLQQPQTQERQRVVPPQPGSVQPPRPQDPSSEALQRQREAERRALEDKIRRDRQTREQPPSQPQLQQPQTRERQRVVPPQPQPQPQAQPQPRLQPQVQQQLQQQEHRRGVPQQQQPQPPPLPQSVSPEASQQPPAVTRRPVEEGKEQRKKQQLPPSQQPPAQQ